MVVIHRYSRYPEVEVVRSTKASVIMPKLVKIFSANGMPLEITIDNGSPFNGNDFERYFRIIGVTFNSSTPKWPQDNAEVERFMQTLNKALITATMEGKKWQQEPNRFLLQYRSTPHTVTKVPLAELLFNRTIRGTLPCLKLRKIVNRHKQAVENEQVICRYTSEIKEE